MKSVHEPLQQLTHNADLLPSPGSYPVLQAEIADEIFTKRPIMTAKSEQLSAFSDERWDLSVLEPNREASRPAVIDFSLTPRRFVQSIKRIAWTWINLPTPIQRLTRKTAARGRLSPVTIAGQLNYDVQWFLEHLDDRGVTSLADATTEDYKTFLSGSKQRGWSRETYARILFSITRLWLSSVYVPEADRLPMPLWETDGIEAVLGKSNWTPENKSEPIHPETMGPLLIWALRFVEEFSPDVLRAIRTKEKLRRNGTSTTKEGYTQQVRDYAVEIKAAGTAVPSVYSLGQLLIAGEYIAALINVPRQSVRRELFEGLPLGAGAPLPIEIEGRIAHENEPWLDAIDYYDTPQLSKLLATACLIVVAYLSGMRGQEVAELKRGCCTTTTSQTGHPPRYKITGKEYKGSLDGEGNRILGGRTRENPWIVIQPVAKAIEVVESLSNSDYLFDSTLFLARTAKPKNRARSTSTLSIAIRDFAAWVNQFCMETGRQEHMIPDDPAGHVNMRRLRRTLAWFIYRQPQGRVALGIQYGHVKSMTADGYGSRSSTGLRGLYPVEGALALVDSLNVAAEHLTSGEQVSGPSAQRYIDGVMHFNEQYAGKTLTSKQMNALSKNPRVRIYDNGHQPVACCYDSAKALCHPDNNRPKADLRTSPDLTRCNPNCGNVARTDRHIDGMRAEVTHLRVLIEDGITPQPIKRRYQQRIDTLTKLIEQHEATKRAAE